MAPAPTTAAITVRDLQIRLYQFADDSMLGRQVGRVGNMKGTAYIAAELKRLGLVPAGNNGTFFQVLPYHLRQFTTHSMLTVNGNPLRWNDEWLAVPGQRAPRPITDAEVIFGGIAGDTTNQISAQQAAGKFVVLSPAPPQQAPASAGRAGGGCGGRGGFGGFGGGIALINRRSGTHVEVFFRDWREVHGPRVAALPGVCRYVQCHTRRSAYDSGRTPAFDGAAMAWLDGVAAPAEATAAHSDPKRSVQLLARELVVLAGNP